MTTSTRTAATAALFLLLAGCASGQTPAPHAEAKPTRASASPSPSARAAAVTPTPSASTTAPSPSPTASDGASLEACQDGTCTVELRKGDRLQLASGFVIDQITVTSVGPDRIDLKMLGSSGGGLRIEGTNVSVSGKCINGDCEDVAEMTVTTGSPGTVNQLRFRLERVHDGHATLALTHASK